MNTTLRALALVFCCLSFTAFADSPPKVMLAKTYEQQSVNGWLASEKLDGVRGVWDGKTLWSKQGNRLNAPESFLASLPPFALDGELYMGRGLFSQTSAKIRKGEDWSGIGYYIFDVPGAEGGLLKRLEVFDSWLSTHRSNRVHLIKQHRIKSIDEAQKMLERITSQGGEGVMLRDPDAPYVNKRTHSMLKLKRFDDAECVVTEHFHGNGKYANQLGSLLCKTQQYGPIRIGSGFSDQDRQNPPPIGSIITYRFNGLTSKGKPRFARFWRIRVQKDQQ